MPGPRSADRLPRPLRKRRQGHTRPGTVRRPDAVTAKTRIPASERPSAAGGPFRYASHTTSNPDAGRGSTDATRLCDASPRPATAAHPRRRPRNYCCVFGRAGVAVNPDLTIAVDDSPRVRRRGIGGPGASVEEEHRAPRHCLPCDSTLRLGPTGRLHELLLSTSFRASTPTPTRRPLRTTTAALDRPALTPALSGRSGSAEHVRLSGDQRRSDVVSARVPRSRKGRASAIEGAGPRSGGVSCAVAYPACWFVVLAEVALAVDFNGGERAGDCV